MTELLVPSTEFKHEFVQGSIKAAITANGIKTRDLPMVPIDSIVAVKDLNVRIRDEEYAAHVEEIAQSILENGFYAHKPLSGYVAKEGDSSVVYCTGGFTRLEAAKLARERGAPIEALPMVFKPAGTSMADLMLALDVDNIGSPLRPYERAIVAKRLIDFGWEEETIAKKMGLSGQYVKDLLYMMSLPNGLRMIVAKSIASAAHVVQLAKKVGPSEALKAFEASAAPEQHAETASAEAPATTTTPTRVSRSQTAAATVGKAAIIPKKTLFNAIDYALSLPSGGLGWLGRWRKGEDEAVAELAAYKPPRKASKPKAAKPAKDKTKGAKGGKGKGKTTEAGDDDAPL